jgi:endoglucanase
VTARREFIVTGVLVGAALGVILLALELGLGGTEPAGGGGSGGGGGLAAAAARRFLAKYVDSSGRVVRWDQGGDTVSEGQSYALLLAEVAGDQSAFRRVWHWTSTHLQSADGLLASHADASKIIDAQPASDADVVTAWALARASGDGAADYRREARSIARAVLEHETVWRTGRPTLAAGPWATGSPASLNPSYWALPAFAGLSRATGDQRWAALAGASVADVQALTGGTALPPDWARLDGGAISATPSPDGQPPAVQYGPDAQRVVVWLASSCDPRARAIAAGWWPKLSSPAAGSALALGTDGKIVAGGASPLALVAAAASAKASGHTAVRDRLLSQAGAVEQGHPSYYGAAWVALGRALLGGGALSSCGTGAA